MKFTKWYEKNRPILVALISALMSISSLLFLFPKLKKAIQNGIKPLQQLLETMDYAVNVGGVMIENVNVRE